MRAVLRKGCSLGIKASWLDVGFSVKLAKAYHDEVQSNDVIRGVIGLCSRKEMLACMSIH